MKEDFLHHIWQFGKFAVTNLTTHTNEPLQIISPGYSLRQAGPDFFNAQLVIGTQKWAGNVEIHLKSSDWYVHHHEKDANYKNVILHVVWEHDAQVFGLDNTEIPVLELKNYVCPETLAKYQELATPKTWIPCENQLKTIPDFILNNWQERLFFERLERKATPIQQRLLETENDWEAVLFSFLAKNFGLNINGELFYKMAVSLPFSVIRKEKNEVENLEALFFGITGLLHQEVEDVYFFDLKKRWDYLEHKHRLNIPAMAPLQFFGLRPDNFPTIRLAQLAQVYAVEDNLFSKIIACKTVNALYSLFSVKVSAYWQTHYRFDKTSPNKQKGLSKSFVDLLIINTVIPLRFCYANCLGKENNEEIIDILNEIPSERNTIIDKFKNFGVMAQNAFQSQALLQLKGDYCNAKKCLQCAVGVEMLKK